MSPARCIMAGLRAENVFRMKECGEMGVDISFFLFLFLYMILKRVGKRILWVSDGYGIYVILKRDYILEK